MKDLRTDVESTDPDSVLDGDLDRYQITDTDKDMISDTDTVDTATDAGTETRTWTQT